MSLLLACNVTTAVRLSPTLAPVPAARQHPVPAAGSHRGTGATAPRADAVVQDRLAAETQVDCRAGVIEP